MNEADDTWRADETDDLTLACLAFQPFSLSFDSCNITVVNIAPVRQPNLLTYLTHSKMWHMIVYIVAYYT